MKVLFINPPGFGTNEYPPLGMLYVAATARINKHKVDVYDAGIDGLERALLFIKTKDYDVFAFSLYTTNLLDTYDFIDQIRKDGYKNIIVVGGPHATALPKQTMLECSNIDYLVYGEGEETFVELLDVLGDSKKIEDVKGVYYRDKGKILNTESRPYIENLDTIQTPAWDLVDKHKYPMDMVLRGKKVATIITSRGCPYNCDFCSKAVFGTRYRRRSPENVVREIKFLKEVNKVDELYFVDDLFAFDRNWLNRFYEELGKEQINLPWKCLGRVDKLNFDDYKKMRQHGCYVIEFGIESGNNEILKDIHKNITTKQAVDAVREAKKAGLAVHTFWIFGHKLDTEETIKETVNLAMCINSDFVSFFVLVPFPGTKVYKYLPEDLRYHWDRISYYHKNTEPISICNVSPKRLLELENYAFFRYFLRFKYIRENILQTQSGLQLVKLKMIAWRLKKELLKK